MASRKRLPSCHPSVAEEAHDMRSVFDEDGEGWFYCSECWAHTAAPPYDELLDTELHYEHQEGQNGRWSQQMQSEWDSEDPGYKKMVDALQKYHQLWEQHRGTPTHPRLEVPQ